jgi:hypothetical protein
VIARKHNVTVEPGPDAWGWWCSCQSGQYWYSTRGDAYAGAGRHLNAWEPRI